MARLAAVVIVLCALTAGAARAESAPEASPGLVVTLEESGIKAITAAVLPVLNKALSGTIPLPDMNEDLHVPVFGHVTLDLTNIAISGFQLPALDVALAAPDTITTTASGLTLDVNLDFKWRKVHWPHASDHGTISVKASGGAMDLGMSLTSVGGKPHLNVLTSTVDLSSFDIHFSGKVSWLYNFVVGLFKGKLKTAVQGAVSKELTTVIDSDANKALAAMHMLAYVGGGRSRADLNYELASVNATSTYIAIGDLMGITNNMTGAACPLAPAPLPVVDPVSPSSMVQLVLADTFINCFGWVAATNDALHERVDPTKLPGLLNTTAWASIAPGLAKKYPDTPLAMYVDLLGAPMVHSSTASGTSAAGHLALNFSAVTKTGEVHTHALGLLGNFGLQVGVEAAGSPPVPTLMFNVTELAVNVSALDTQVGPIDVTGLDGLLGTVLPLVKDILQAALSKGLPLPGTPTGVGLVHPQVSQGNGYIAISADLSLGEAVQIAAAAVGVEL